MEIKETMPKPLENEGIWCRFGDSDLEIKIASNTSEEYRKALRKKLSAKRRELGGTLPEELDEELTVDCVAEFIVKDWRGLTEDGKPVEPTLENKLRVMRKSFKIQQFVINRAVDQAMFDQASEDQALENLGKG